MKDHFKTKSNKKTKFQNITTNVTKKIRVRHKVPCIDMIIKPIEPDIEKKYTDVVKKATQKETELITKMLSEKIIPKNINPTTDFYTFINYRWLKQQSQMLGLVKTYYVKVDSFRVVQDNVYKELIGLVKKYISNNKEERRVKNLHNFLTSWYGVYDYNGYKNGQEIIKKIDTYLENPLSSPQNLYKFLAFINKYEFINTHSPIFWNIMPDSENTKIYAPIIDVGENLFSLDVDIYFKQKEELARDEKYKRFLAYIDGLFRIYFGENHDFKPEDVFDVEKECMDVMYNSRKICKKGEKRHNDDDYKLNRTTPEDAKKNGFDCCEFFKELGYKTLPKYFLSSNDFLYNKNGEVGYINCLMNILKENWTTKKWRTFWYYIFLKQVAEFSKHHIHNWKFFREFLKGEKAFIPADKKVIFGLSIGYNVLLTKLYIEKNPMKTELEYVKILTNDFKRIFRRMLENNNWLQPSTKKSAIQKLDALKFIYGTPEILTKDPDLNYDKHNCFENIMHLCEYRTNTMIKITSGRVLAFPTVDWKEYVLTSSQAYLVNAFYTPMFNNIMIPQAILQKPFLDLQERGIEYNLAFIGYTLCHEMSHSLDENGSKYDYKGNYNNWWKPEDAKIFHRKNKDIIRQYELFAKRDGLKFDASISVGEDLADIVASNILTIYLRDFQETNKDPIYIRDLSFKAYFTYYAIQARQTIYKSAVNAEISSNPHPLEKYRVNCVLARNPIFHLLYGIKRGDKMFWNTSSFW